MFANIAETVYGPGQRQAARTQIEEFQALGARQPGMRGTIQVDAGEGRVLTLTLWEDQATLDASRPVVAVAAEQLRPFWSGPSQRVGFGEVVRDSSLPGASYALLASATYTPGQQEAGLAQADEYRALVDQQPGARGAIFIDAGGGRQLILRLWASAAEQQASSAALRAAFDRLVAPWQTAPLEWLGNGAIIRNTFHR